MRTVRPASKSLPNNEITSSRIRLEVISLSIVIQTLISHARSSWQRADRLVVQKGVILLVASLVLRILITETIVDLLEVLSDG